MDSMKEKLVELLSHSPSLDALYGYPSFVESAEWLIANGVTVQEWIPVTERLPEDMVDVLTCDAKGNIHIMWHHHEFRYPFNVGRRDLRYFPVTHWMPLPQPPKGE